MLSALISLPPRRTPDLSRLTGCLCLEHTVITAALFRKALRALLPSARCRLISAQVFIGNLVSTKMSQSAVKCSWKNMGGVTWITLVFVWKSVKPYQGLLELCCNFWLNGFFWWVSIQKFLFVFFICKHFLTHIFSCSNIKTERIWDRSCGYSCVYQIIWSRTMKVRHQRQGPEEEVQTSQMLYILAFRNTIISKQ